MPAQPGYGRQFDKRHAVTVTAQGPITKYRFVSYDGAHTPAAPATPVKDAQGIAEESAAIGEAWTPAAQIRVRARTTSSPCGPRTVTDSSSMSTARLPSRTTTPIFSSRRCV